MTFQSLITIALTSFALSACESPKPSENYFNETPFNDSKEDIAKAKEVQVREETELKRQVQTEENRINARSQR